MDGAGFCFSFGRLGGHLAHSSRRTLAIRCIGWRMCGLVCWNQRRLHCTPLAKCLANQQKRLVDALFVLRTQFGFTQ